MLKLNQGVQVQIQHLTWPLRGLAQKGDGANMGAGSHWPSKSTCSRKWVSLSNKWMFLINQLQWLAQVRWWELNSLSFCIVHLFRFMGEDGRQTRQWSLDVLNIARGLPQCLLSQPLLRALQHHVKKLFNWSWIVPSKSKFEWVDSLSR